MSSILPPEENAINLQSSFAAESSTVKVSDVFPDMLVVTRVFLSTVFGKRYLLISDIL